MKLSELHTAIEAGRGPDLNNDQSFATLVAIEHLARIEGIPVSALDFSAPQFGAKFAYQCSGLGELWPGRTQYLAWRNLILNAQMRFMPGDVDADPWASLSRAERLWKDRRSATLSGLYSRLPPDTHPRGVTDALLAQIQEGMTLTVPPPFRAGVNAFRQLFRNDLALRTGLLPKVCPNPLPGIRDHQLHSSLSPEINAWRNSLSDREVILALDYLNRLAIAGGRLNGKTDTLEDLRVALCDLPAPEEVDIPSITGRTLRIYVNQVRHTLGGPDPRKTPAEQAWADLRAAARTAGCETSFLWALGKPAATRGLFPTGISENVALELMGSYENASMWSHFRRGCEQFDALRGKIPPDLLPPSPLGIQCPPRRSPRALKPVLPPDPTKTSWGELYARLRGHGWKPSQLSNLSYLRVRATAAGIAPNDLNQSFTDILDREATDVTDRNRLRAAVLGITALSKDLAFSDLPNLSPPGYTKFTHGGASEKARDELEELMEFMHAAATTRRSFRVAIGVLTDAMGRPDISLTEIFEADPDAYDFGAHEPRRKVHVNKIRNLRDFHDLAWTPAWRKLQQLVVGTGMTAQLNPVPKVLSWNPGGDPRSLTKEWAQRFDLELRSTLKNPPHGRADLAITLARHLSAFDALQDIPAVAGSRLLPPKIGPIR